MARGVRKLILEKLQEELASTQEAIADCRLKDIHKDIIVYSYTNKR